MVSGNDQCDFRIFERLQKFFSGFLLVLGGCFGEEFSQWGSADRGGFQDDSGLVYRVL